MVRCAPRRPAAPHFGRDADRLIGKNKPVIEVALPQGPGADLLLAELKRDWGAIGLTVEQAQSPADADFALIDEVAPSLLRRLVRPPLPLRRCADL